MDTTRPSLLVSLCIALVVAGCTSDVEDPPSVDPDRPVDAAVDVTGSCPDDDLVDALAAWGGAGFSGALVLDGPGLVCRLGVGRTGGDGPPITAATTSAIGSVTKAVVAVAVLRLEAAGVLSLADPAGRHVAGLTGPAAGATVESLLLHTSGLVGTHGEDSVPLDRDQAVAAISGLAVDDAFRGRFLYSNAGYSLLALVIEGATGTGYRQHLLDQVLPAGAGFAEGTGPGTHWATQGNGDVAMSAGQLADWTREAFTGDLLPASAVDRMLEPALEADGRGIGVGWGHLAEDVLGEPAVGAAGGGGDTPQEAVVVWLPASSRAIAVTSHDERFTAEALLQAIGPAIVAGEPLPRPDDRVAVDGAVLDAAVGEYELGSGDRFEVRRVDDGLVVTPTGGDALAALLPPSSPPAEVAEHEAAVAALLAGATDAGADEVAVLEEGSGELRDVEVLGSIDDGELRTYVELTFADGVATGWYALDDAGGIEGVDLGGLPEVPLVHTAEGFRVEGRRPGDEAVAVSFDGDAMSVRGSGGTAVAERA